MKATLKSGLFFICIYCLFIAGNALAGTITIRMQTTLTVSADRIEVLITAANLGTEPAHDLQAFLHIFDRSLASGITPRLDVGQTRSFRLHLPIPSAKKGHFPFIGEVLYHDANNQPFSALSCDVFHLKHKAVSELTGHVSNLTIKGSGKLSVQICNPLSRPLNCTATLHLPKGLATPLRQKYFAIDPNREKIIEFQVIDRYETESAVYPIFCALEYEEGGVHYSKILQSTVRIKAFKNWFKKTKWWWLAGVVPIVLMWLGILLLNRKQSGNGGPRLNSTM